MGRQVANGAYLRKSSKCTTAGAIFSTTSAIKLNLYRRLLGSTRPVKQGMCLALVQYKVGSQHALQAGTGKLQTGRLYFVFILDPREPLAGARCKRAVEWQHILRNMEQGASGHMLSPGICFQSCHMKSHSWFSPTAAFFQN